MNYVHTLLFIALSSQFLCFAMKKESPKSLDLKFDNLHLDYARHFQEAGVTQGAAAANDILSKSKDTTDLVRPLLNEMTKQAPHLDDHKDSTSSHLKGFFTAYALILYKHNQQNPDSPVKLNADIFNERMKSFQTGLTKNKQRSRAELVKLLTTSLTNHGLL